jgi:L-fuconolactonase
MSLQLSVPIVDIHSHVIADDAGRYPTAPMGGKQSEWSLLRPVTASGMLQAMHEAGVSQSVLVQASTCYGLDNSYVAACVAQHPREFTGVFSADLQAAAAIERIQQWMAVGMGGLRVFVAGHTAADAGARLDDPSAAPAWDYAVRHKIPVSVQLRADKLGQLDSVLMQWPKAIVILDHCARPELDDGPPYAKAGAVFALAKYKNLHLKYTTHNVREAEYGSSTNAAFCQALVNHFGAHRMAWGSNFPASTGSLRSQLQEALKATSKLTADEQAWIFSRTARSLYPTLGNA